MSNNNIPILTYHSIRAGETIDPALLDCHFRVLAESGMASLLPEDLDCSSGGFLITFDDGFADFYRYVFPLLKKYELKATVFVIVRYIGEGPGRLSDDMPDISAVEAHNQAAESSGPHPAFLKWEELKEMESSGYVRVHSHSYQHKMGWVSDQIRGFHLPPFSNTAWYISQVTDGDTRYGIPVFKRGSSLASRKFYDHEELRNKLSDWIIKNGGEKVLESEKPSVIEHQLSKIVERFKKTRGNCGRWETEDERYKRTIKDLQKAREVLEERLGGVRDELCLPWGEYDSVTIECARALGLRRLYTLDRALNPVGNIGRLVNRFEPRARGAHWLKMRMWIYRSITRTWVYSKISNR